MKQLFRRVEKLEHNEVIVGGMSPMARFEAAWDQSALRLTGRNYKAISGDETLVDRTLKDLATWYIPKLSNADLATLKAEFEALIGDAELAALKAQFAAEHEREGRL